MLGEPKICCFPYFLADVLKKQEISQQVLFYNFHLIGYFHSNNQGRNHGRKVEILELTLPLTCFLLPWQERDRR